MPAIHWFRRDLRLADNPALLAAVSDGPDVVGLYVLDARLWSTAGLPRLVYLLRSLRALDESTGGRLLVRRGDPRTVVPEVVRSTGASSVHVAAAYEPYGRRRDDEVERALAGLDVPLVRTGSPYVVSPGQLMTRTGTPFQVFTPFRTAWLEHGWRAPARSGDAVTWADAGPTEPLPPEPDLEGLVLPPAGERAAVARWAAVRDGPLAEYATERDRPDLDTTSRLSVALRWGELHPRTLLADIAGLAGPELTGTDSGPATFRSQLAWRDFHADVLHHHPGARTRSLREVVPEDSWASADEESTALAAWAAGRTGYPLVDAGMRQLRAEGWMHNRVRMVTASFLVKDLHVRWQRGAEHFMRWLADGDIAQNQLNWQWVAGTGRDAAQYVRIFNPVTQGLRFDPEGAYVRRWVPELRAVPGRAVHEPWLLPPGAAPGYPARMVDHAVERQVALAAFDRLRRA
ncbi:deoxyribodipyrimidine photo-lyase [Actinomycetota bacterium]|nr:deoxyribodipyrimidine photo-lyase [Actinomycetota bacterium]